MFRKDERRYPSVSVIITFIQNGDETVGDADRGGVQVCRCGGLAVLVALMNVAVKQVLRFAFIVGADYFDMRIVSGTFFPWQMKHILDEGGKFGIGADAVSQMEGQESVAGVLSSE